MTKVCFGIAPMALCIGSLACDGTTSGPAFVLAVAAEAGPGGQARESPAELRVRIVDNPSRGMVRRAVLGAARRLERPDCAELLNDFADGSGRPLSEAPALAGTTPSQYLVEAVWFVDGAEAPQCRGNEHMLAFTAVGSQVVYVCGTRFASRFETDLVQGDVLIIHELLHVLGLGENPPAGSAITRQVTKRCGSG